MVPLSVHKVFIGLDVVKSQFKQPTLPAFEYFTQFLVLRRAFDGVLVWLPAA